MDTTVERRNPHYIAKKHGKIFPSVDTDTPISDLGNELLEKNLITLDYVIDKCDINGDENLRNFEVERYNMNLTEISNTVIEEVNDVSDLSDINSVDDSESFIGESGNTEATGNNGDKIPQTDDEKCTDNKSSNDSAQLVKNVHRRSSLISNLFSFKNATNPQQGKKKSRSCSDTRNPMTFFRLNSKTNQFETDIVDENHRPSDDQRGFNTLDSISANDSTLDEEHKKEPINEPVSNRMKRRKDWMRKSSKAVTFDEGYLYLIRQGESADDQERQIEEKQVKSEQNDDTEVDNCEQGTSATETPQRKISTGKLFKQSMTQGFAMFKNSINRKSSLGNKENVGYCVIDNEVLKHETSRRVTPLTPELSMDENHLQSAQVWMSENLRKRSYSVPDNLDNLETSSICDEDLNDLYLPRRMAICPDLPVPAVNQLRTYLMFTQLKQYCI